MLHIQELNATRYLTSLKTIFNVNSTILPFHILDILRIERYLVLFFNNQNILYVLILQISILNFFETEAKKLITIHSFPNIIRLRDTSFSAA